MCPATNFGDFTFEMWTKVVAVNLNAMFLCANAAFRIMRDQKPQGGRIINNGSISAHAPRPGSVGLHLDQARSDRADQVDRAGRSAVRHRSGQIDIGNAATPMTARSTRAYAAEWRRQRLSRAWT